MTKILFILALFPLAASAAQINVSGKAARELYDSLNIKAVNVVDEHSNTTYATAKYGKSFGCERSLESDSTYCWFTNQN